MSDCCPLVYLLFINTCLLFLCGTGIYAIMWFMLIYRKEGKTEKTLYYNTHYGTVLLNDQVMLENDERAACKEGDRVRITLDFCDVSHIMRKPTFCKCKNKGPDQLRSN